MSVPSDRVQYLAPLLRTGWTRSELLVFDEADGVASLYGKVSDAVPWHFEEGQVPKVIRLHFVREEVISA